MCRFLLLKSKEPVRLCDVLTNPDHSIIKQSYDSRLRVDDTRPLNGPIPTDALFTLLTAI